MIDIAIIGCGFIGARHAGAVSEHPSLRLASVADVNEQQAASVAERYNADMFTTDVDVGLNSADAAIVATPEQHHFDHAQKVLDRDMDLLLEKPITDDLDDAETLAKRCSDSSNVTAVSFILRYDTRYQRAQKLARNGDLGRIVAARAMRGITYDESHRVGPRGHPNYYMSIHDIDALIAAIDSKVSEVTATEVSEELSDIDVPDAMQALLKFENGTTATLEGYGVMPNNTPGGIVADYKLIGTDGTASVKTPGNGFTITREDYDRPDVHHWPIVDGRVSGAIKRQMSYFARALTGERDMLATVTDGWEAQRVATAIQQSSIKDRSISLSDG